MTLEKYNGLDFPPKPEIVPASESSAPSLAKTADDCTLFLGSVNKNKKPLSLEDRRVIQGICDYFNGWLGDLEAQGLKVEISLNSTARDKLKTEARVMNVGKLDHWYLTGVGDILRTGSPLRIKEVGSGKIVHQAEYEEVEIRERVLPSIRRPQH